MTFMLSKCARLLRAVRTAPPEIRVGAVVGLALLWVYLPTLAELLGRWGHDAQYSHGYLVPLFAAYLLWTRRSLLPGAPRPSWGGSALLLAGLGLHFAGTYLFFDWLAAAALVPSVAGLVLLVGGRRALRWAWPAVAFLIFMVPLPHRLEVGLAQPLQRVATAASTYALQTLGFVAFAEGNVIRLGEVRIGVAEACSGLSMLLIFFALAIAVALVIDRSWYEKLLLVASAVPIALAANCTRITVTAILEKTINHEVAHDVFHDGLAPWLMMLLALGLLWVELRLFAWVILPRQQEEVTVFAAGLKAKGKSAPPVKKAAAPAPAAKTAAAPAKAGKRVVLAGLGLALPPRKEAKTSSAQEVP
jgi:exosortase